MDLEVGLSERYGEAMGVVSGDGVSGLSGP